MNIKSKIIRRIKGPRKGQLLVRLTYFDEAAGVDKTIERSVIPEPWQRQATKDQAKKLRDKLIKDLQSSGGRNWTGDKMIFSDLIEAFKTDFEKAKFDKTGKRVSGVRSYTTAQNNLAVLKEYFGKKRIVSINRGMIEAYKVWRLEMGSRRPELRKKGEFKPIAVATINNELATMRVLMKKAFAEQWIGRDVFATSKKIITKTEEKARTRRLIGDEEQRLLDACQGERGYEAKRIRFGKEETVHGVYQWEYPFLRAIILVALDTGMRKGEILKLRWTDFDFASNVIHVEATHTKAETRREVPLTERVKSELRRLYEDDDRDPEEPRVFPVADFKRTWAMAKKTAGIDDLHFHDLRSTAVTRWLEYGLPLAQVSKIAGHTNEATTIKYYLIADRVTVDDLTARINAVHAAMDAQQMGEAVN